MSGDTIYEIAVSVALLVTGVLFFRTRQQSNSRVAEQEAVSKRLEQLNAELSIQIETATTTNQTLSETLSQLQTQATATEQTLQATQSQLVSTEAANQTLIQSLQQEQTKGSDLQEQIQNLAQLNTTLETQILEQTQDLKALTKAKKELEVKAREDRATLGYYEKATKDFKQEKVSFVQQLRDVAEVRDHLRKLNESLETKLQQQQKLKETQLKELTDRCTQLESELQEERATVGSLGQRLSDLDQARVDLEQQLQQVSSAHEQTVADLTQSHAQEKTQLESDLVTEQQKIRELNAHLEQQQELTTTLSQQLRDLTQAKLAAESSLEDLQAQMATVETTHSHLQAIQMELDQVKAERDQMKAELNQASERVKSQDSKQDEMVALKNQNQLLLEATKRLSAELEHEKKTRSSHSMDQGQVNELIKENELLSRRIQQAREVVVTLQQQNRTLKIEKEQLTRQLNADSSPES